MRSRKVMETFWFAAVAVMLTAFVVLDGFDLGAGAILALVARSREERDAVLRSIGPVWDGNEVWLIAAGGTLVLAFPRLYASSFSGFYLPLMIVLWLFIARALGIELRHQVDSPLWTAFFDFCFAGSSLLLAVFLGAALGNVMRGVPLDAEGYFFAPLWTTFSPGPHPGILDWYTVLIGGSAAVILSVHGASYVAVKADGPLNGRCRALRGRGLIALSILTPVGLLATVKVRPDVLSNYEAHPVGGLLIPLAVLGSLSVFGHSHLRGLDRRAFVASCAYIASMLGGAAFALYPAVLPSTTSPSLSLTVHNSAAGAYGLRTALYWWFPGMALALGYFVFVYRTFRGKV
jgi:cytochrome bd ubiquinol oxidase subunit II